MGSYKNKKVLPYLSLRYFVEVNALGTLHTDTKHNAKTNHQMASMI